MWLAKVCRLLIHKQAGAAQNQDQSHKSKLLQYRGCCCPTHDISSCPIKRRPINTEFKICWGTPTWVRKKKTPRCCKNLEIPTVEAVIFKGTGWSLGFLYVPGMFNVPEASNIILTPFLTERKAWMSILPICCQKCCCFHLLVWT